MMNGSPSRGLFDRPPTPSIYSTPENDTMRDKMVRWWRDNCGWNSEPPPTSGYMTLVPLSDSRLKPRRTKLLVGSLMVLGVVAVMLVFFLVPRGLSVGEIKVESDIMSWNTTKHTYQLKLRATIPIINPNYVQATLGGDLRVVFYDTEAGAGNVSAVRVPARANPYLLKVEVDASNVPSEYTLTILSECAAFPRRLIFFQKLHLKASYLLQRQHLRGDSYFMIDCINGGSIPHGRSGDFLPPPSANAMEQQPHAQPLAGSGPAAA